MGETDEAKSALGGSGLVLCIIVIILAILVILATIPYWVYIHLTVTGTATSGTSTTLALYILSAAVLVLVGVCGLWGSIRYWAKMLEVFAMVNGAMFVVVGVQLALTYVTWLDCLNNNQQYFPNSIFQSICDESTADQWYWIPQVIILFINLCGAFMGCSFSQKIKYALDPPLDHYDS